MKSIQPSTGQIVQIFNSELKIDPEYYRVMSQDRNIVSLGVLCIHCKGTGNINAVITCKSCNGTGTVGKRRVHHSRVARVLDDNLIVVYEVDSLEKEKPVAQTKQTKVAPTEVVSIASLIGNGEHYAKPVSFDHDGVTAEANVVIAADHRSFVTFNTYNGSLGKKGKGGKSYPLADDKSYEQKINQLKKQGYTKK